MKLFVLTALFLASPSTESGTDPAFVGKYVYPPKDAGIYQCVTCKQPLFESADQYDAGSGYPSFTRPLSPKNIYYEKESTPPVQRYEIRCRQCGSHLGHLFHDGPPPKYFRYCVNSSALSYKKK